MQADGPGPDSKSILDNLTESALGYGIFIQEIMNAPEEYRSSIDELQSELEEMASIFRNMTTEEQVQPTISCGADHIGRLMDAIDSVLGEACLDHLTDAHKAHLARQREKSGVKLDMTSCQQ
jgi:hypothetical protein